MIRCVLVIMHRSVYTDFENEIIEAIVLYLLSSSPGPCRGQLVEVYRVLSHALDQTHLLPDLARG